MQAILSNPKLAINVNTQINRYFRMFIQRGFEYQDHFPPDPRSPAAIGLTMSI